MKLITCGLSSGQVQVLNDDELILGFDHLLAGAYNTQKKYKAFVKEKSSYR